MKQLYLFIIRVAGILSLLILFSNHLSVAQTVLNGNFENTTAVGDQINLSNASYNAQMANSFAFGSYGDMDIISSANYCGLAESCNWYVAFTGSGTDAISLTLSAPLVQGNSYTISFWDRGCSPFTPYTFEFGLGNRNDTMGTIIYTEPTAAVVGTWTKHTFTFTAPNNGLYLTMDMTGGGLGDWAQMDNVQFGTGNVGCSPACISQFLASDSVLCQYDCINFTDYSLNNPTSWKWTFTGAAVDTSTMQNPLGVCYPQVGTFPVTLHASNGVGGDTLTITNYIHVSPSPPAPTITQHHDTLVFNSNPAYSSFQWYKDTTLIPGATDTLLVVSQTANYNVKVTNEFGCSIAVGINYTSGVHDLGGLYTVVVYPNPAGDQLTVDGLRFTNDVALNIYNVLGQVASPPAPLQRRGEKVVVDVSGLSARIYFLEIKTVGGMLVRKFVKE